MVTKQQHYYPQGLLKQFANSQEKVYVYNRKAKRFYWVNYRSICYQNYMYESKGVIDNRLEKLFGSYEARTIPIVDGIIQDINYGKELLVSTKQIDLLWDYLWLQIHRTDSGRLLLISDLKTNNDSERIYPVELEEIQANKNLLMEFNDKFKDPEMLKTLLAMTKRPSRMRFRVVIIENDDSYFITSDNPVIVLFSKNSNDLNLIMSINQFVCIMFGCDDLEDSKQLLVKMKAKDVRTINKATINTANYYAISNRVFDVDLTGYILNRFNTDNWKPKYPFVKL